MSDLITTLIFFKGKLISKSLKQSHFSRRLFLTVLIDVSEIPIAVQTTWVVNGKQSKHVLYGWFFEQRVECYHKPSFSKLFMESTFCHELSINKTILLSCCFLYKGEATLGGHQKNKVAFWLSNWNERVEFSSFFLFIFFIAVIILTTYSTSASCFLHLTESLAITIT